MTSAHNFQSRIFLLVTLVTLSLFSFEALHAQETAPLPDYVIEEFGNPPAVPEGPLSAALQSADRGLRQQHEAHKLAGTTDCRLGRNRRRQ